MSGWMRKRGEGVWEVVVSAGRDPLTGRKREISRRVHGSQRDAQKVLNQLAVSVDQRRYSGTKSTFRDLITRWLELASPDLSPSTLRGYESLLRVHILPAFGDMPVTKIKPMALDDFYQGLRRRKGLSPARIRQAHAVIRRALRQAEIWGWIDSNPAARATPPKLIKFEITPPEPGQVIELIEHATTSDPLLARLIHLAATTGARRGELCALRWRHVDFKTGTLRIERSITEVPGGIAEKDTKTHAARRMNMDARTLAILKTHYDEARQRAHRYHLKITKDSFVFSNEPNGMVPWRPDSVSKRFAELKKTLGYDTIRFHDLRHFAATRLVAAGVPIRTVSGRLGHANPSTTLSVYSHFVEESDHAAAGILDDLLDPTLDN